MNKSKLIKLLMVMIFTVFLGSKSYAMCQIMPEFQSTPSHICAGDSVLFTNTTGAEISIWLAFHWDFNGGAVNDTASNIDPPVCHPSTAYPTQSFYKQFNTPGTYIVTLKVYKTSDTTSNYTYVGSTSHTIIVDDYAWANINVSSTYICNTPFLVTDNNYNILSSTNSLGHVTSISWELYDYNQNLTTSQFSQIGDMVNIVTYPYSPNSMQPLPIGQYYLIMKANGFCTGEITDSINFFITGGVPEINSPEVVCIGDTVMFVGNSSCPDVWNWNFGDGSTVTNNDTVYHIYNGIGTYQVSLQANTGGDYGYTNIEVVQAQTPIITGYNNNCDDVVTYSIDNYDSDYSYTWSTRIYNEATGQYTTGQYTINGNSNVETENTADIDWTSAAFPQLPNYVVITVEARLNGSNCSNTSSMNITKCCSLDGYTLFHDTVINTNMSFVNETQLVINGTVTFSAGVSFDQSEILMGPLAKIIVNNNSKFEAIRTTFQSKQCLYMNDGIYAETANDSIVFIDESELSSSINGLYSSNGAYLKAENSTFMNNRIGIQIVKHKSVMFPYPPPAYTPGVYSITNCTFGVSQSSPLVLTYPYNNHQPLTGINISEVEGINIGDNTLGGNVFSKLRNGITIYNSKVNIYNNTFEDIESIMYEPLVNEAAIAINSIGVNDMANISEVTIGTSGNSVNEFNNCFTGIYSNNSKLLANNNIFRYGQQSINVFNFMNGTNIQYNKFKDINYGIKINNLLGVSRKLDIEFNYFGGQYDNSVTQVSREAINLINCNSQAYSSNRTKVSNNTIKFAGAKQYITSGIRVQNCEGVIVSSNHIYRAGNFQIVNNDWTNTIGIRIAGSHGATITDNYIFGFGQSITTWGNLNLTQFSCNELKIYKYGFYWDMFTSLSDQGLLDVRDNHNEWYSPISGSEKLAQGSSADYILNTDTVKWFYNSSFGNNWHPNSVYNTNWLLKIQATSNNNAPHLCVGGSGPNGSGTGTGGGTSNGSGNTTVIDLIKSIEDPEMRDLMFEDLMVGEKYTDLQNEYRAYDADFLYKMLDVDTTMMWLGGDKDVDFRKFFYEMREANIGKFDKVYDLIELGNIEEAIDVNNNISPEQNIFANLKTVLDIYLNTWCKNEYTLSAEEYDNLFAIADQTPYEAGVGVYTARIMIGYEPDDHKVAYRLMHNEEQTDEEALVLYPNPASDKVTIEFSNDNFENVDADLNVYSITGKLVYKTRFNTINSFKQLSVDMLKNGVYIYHISLSNGVDKSGKLVILKQ